MEKRRPIIRDIQEFQTVEAHQIHQLGLEQTPRDVLHLLRGEIGELEEALGMGGIPEIASEIADVIILTTRIASLHDIPLEHALSDKLNRNAHKYNPHHVRRLRDEGQDSVEAMGILKKLWNRDDDKKFCSACGRAS